MLFGLFKSKGRERSKIESRKNNALRIVRFLKEMLDKDYLILLRPNGEVAVAYFKQRVLRDGIHRLMLHVVDMMGREYREYADYYNGASLESCFVIQSYSAPIALTVRKRASLSDDEDEFEWVILGARAEKYAELKSDYERMYEELSYLRKIIRNREKIIEDLERRLSVLNEELRDARNTIDLLLRENSVLRRDIYSLRSIIERYAAEGALSQSIANQLLSEVDRIGRHALVKPSDVREFMKEMGELAEMYSLHFSPNNENVIDVERVAERGAKKALEEFTKGGSKSEVKEEEK